jgi:hypothetical protein
MSYLIFFLSIFSSICIYIYRSVYADITQVVSKVGVDINKIVTRPFMQRSLDFVCGLGPIKSKNLLDTVKRKGMATHPRTRVLCSRSKHDYRNSVVAGIRLACRTT